jgi:hypothetical protein
VGKKIKEYYSMMPDSNQDRGYGKLNGDAKNRIISSNLFPYDEYEHTSPEDSEFNDPLLQNKFSSMTGKQSSTKSDYVSRRSDPFSYFDDSTVGLSEQKLIKEYVHLIIEAIISNKSRTSNTDGATTQWGNKVPGGTQFGWSSAYPFPQKKSQYEPVFSLKDLMTKHQDETGINGTLDREEDEEWKKEYGEEQYDNIFPLFW